MKIQSEGRNMVTTCKDRLLTTAEVLSMLGGKKKHQKYWNKQKLCVQRDWHHAGFRAAEFQLHLSVCPIQKVFCWFSYCCISSSKPTAASIQHSHITWSLLTLKLKHFQHISQEHLAVDFLSDIEHFFIYPEITNGNWIMTFAV